MHLTSKRLLTAALSCALAFSPLALVGAAFADDLSDFGDGISTPPVRIDGQALYYIAQIGETTYDSLAEAFEAAQPGDVIEVGLGIDEPIDWPAKAEVPEGVTIQGQGSDLTTLKAVPSEDGNGIQLTNPKVTITGVAIDGSDISGTDDEAAISVKADGCLLDDVSIDMGKSRFCSAVYVDIPSDAPSFSLRNSHISCPGYVGLDGGRNGANISVEGCVIDAYSTIHTSAYSGFLDVSLCKLNGLVSVSLLDKATFTECDFSEGADGTCEMVTYAATEFNDCTFSEGFQLGTDISQYTPAFDISFKNCMKGEQDLTKDNFMELFADHPELWEECDCYVNGELVGEEEAVVCRIGNTEYTSLAAAIDAVPTNGRKTTITVATDVDIKVAARGLTIPTGKHVILDLHGHTVKGLSERSDYMPLITNQGELVIADGTGTGEGKLVGGADATWQWGDTGYDAHYTSKTIRNEGKLLVNGGMVLNVSKGTGGINDACAIENVGNGTIEVNNGCIDTMGAPAIFLVDNNRENGFQDVSICGGTIGHSNRTSASAAAIYVSGARSNIAINDGVLTGRQSIYALGGPGSLVTVYGGTLDGAFFTGGLEAVRVDGGSFRGGFSESGNDANFIYGGIFAERPADELLAKGLCVTDNQDAATKGEYPFAIGKTAEMATYTYNIALQDAIDIHFYVNNLKGNPSDYAVEYTFGDGETQVEALQSAKRNDIVIASCAAKEMTDEAHVVVTYKGTPIKEASYSIRGYCDYIFNNVDESASEANGRLVDLCRATLDYGSYAQVEFKHNTDDLANGGVNYFANDEIVVPEMASIQSGYCEGITSQTFSLVTMSKTQFVIYLKHAAGADKGDYTFTVDGERLGNDEVTDTGEKFAICIEGIAAKDLAAEHTVTAQRPGRAGVYVYTASPVCYMYKAIGANASAALNRAFYNYYTKAAAYL